MNINGRCRLYAKEFDGRIAYSTTISNKNKDGKYENMFVQVQLPKDMLVADKTDIEIKKGFISNFKKSSGEFQIKFIVQEFDVITATNEAIDDNDDSLPF